MSQIVRLGTIITASVMGGGGEREHHDNYMDAFIACYCYRILLSAVDCMITVTYLELSSVLPLPLLFQMTYCL